MLNKIMVQGRIGKDIEVRHTQSGVSVASFTVACDRDFKDKATGERQTDWFTVVAWRSLADFCGQYLSKGRSIIVDGSLQTRQYEKDGQKRTATEIVAEHIYFADSKPADGGYQSGGYNQAGSNQSQYKEPEFADLTDDDGDLPF